LPEDKEALKAILRSLRQERNNQIQRAEAQAKCADELYLENPQLQKELLRYKKATHAPRADRLSENELAQAPLCRRARTKPLPAGSIPQGEAQPEVRHIERRKGPRALAKFDNLPVGTHDYELSAEQQRRSGCGEQRQEISSEESWQIEYLLAYSSACGTCARTTRASVASKPAKIPRSRRRRKRRRCYTHFCVSQYEFAARTWVIASP
jgi:hypothetical protein